MATEFGARGSAAFQTAYIKFGLARGTTELAQGGLEFWSESCVSLGSATWPVLYAYKCLKTFAPCKKSIFISYEAV